MADCGEAIRGVDCAMNASSRSDTWRGLSGAVVVPTALVLGIILGGLSAGAQDVPPPPEPGPAVGAPEQEQGNVPPPAARPRGVQAPGPERFAVPPRSPAELWDAADYLIRSGQARLAVPYLNAFVQANPDDATLLALRDRFGIGSFLRLQDDPATRPMAQPLLDRLAVATRRVAADPQRIAQAIELLTRTPEEQTIGVDRLREAGPYAVPPLIRALAGSASSPERRAALVASMSRLDARAVPALTAALDAPDATLAAEVAGALGRIGDTRAVPELLHQAARPDTPASLRDAAGRALDRLVGRPVERTPEIAAQWLADQAWQYHRGRVAFPAERVELWTWQDDAPAPSVFDRDEAATRLGLRRARQALAIDPSDQSAQVALLSLALERSARQHGVAALAANDPDGTFTVALAAGPGILSDVLRAAIADGHSRLAQAAALALGRVTERGSLGTPRSSALVEALGAPDRRVQFAAAAALIDLDPRSGFPGSSRVVPALTRFLGAQQAPRAVVIDGNLTRAGNAAGALKALGFDPQMAPDGPSGFRLASEQGDVELILIDPTALHEPWTWRDTLSNLRADARTAGIPVFVTGPLALEDRLAPSIARYPRTTFLVVPEDPQLLRSMLDRELGRMGAEPLTAEERQGYARAAATLLARVAGQPGSPFAADLAQAGPELSAALANPAASAPATAALGDVPDPEAQRSLAETLLDPARPAELRRAAGAQLVRSIQRFGPLLANTQERGLLEAIDAERDPVLRRVLAAVVGALNPDPAAIGARLRGFAPLEPEATPERGASPAPGAEVPAPEVGPGAEGG
jgi:hypothetical protein